MVRSARKDNPLWRFLVLVDWFTGGTSSWWTGMNQFALTGLMSGIVSCRAIDFRGVNVAIVSVASTKQYKEVISEHM